MSEEIKITNSQLRSLVTFSKHFLAEGATESPSNATLAEDAHCSIMTVHSRIKVLEEAGFLHVKRWIVPGPARCRRLITVTDKGVNILLQREPELMRKLGFKKNGERRAK